jgi:hypothetical protein
MVEENCVVSETPQYLLLSHVESCLNTLAKYRKLLLLELSSYGWIVTRDMVQNNPDVSEIPPISINRLIITRIMVEKQSKIPENVTRKIAISLLRS